MWLLSLFLLLLTLPFSISHDPHDDHDDHHHDSDDESNDHSPAITIAQIEGVYQEEEEENPPYSERDEMAHHPKGNNDEIIFTLAYTIKTSYCFEAETQSGFEIWAGTLDYYGQLLWIGKLTRDSCRVYQSYNNRFEGKARFIAPRADVIECIQGGNTDACDPRGEVVFIDMREEFVDDWSIEMVTINSIFEYDLVTYNTSFEHSILVPCKTRFDEPAIYQIGPASGQIIKLKELPQVMDWISDHF